MAVSKPWKGQLFTVWEKKQEGRVPHFSASAGNLHVGRIKLFTILGMSASDRERTKQDWGAGGLQTDLSK